MSELFVEVGSEELPARFLAPAMEGLRAGVVKLLGAIPHGEARVYGTPRRIAVVIDDVAARRPSVERVVTGPPVAAAYRDGVATPVAEAFARARGVTVDSLLRVETPKGAVIAAKRLEGGESVETLLSAGLEEAILGVPFTRTMRWGSARWGRPIRFVCAIFGGRAVEGSVAGLPIGDTSDGHWLLAPERFRVTSGAQWIAELRERHVEPDLEARRQRIRAELAAAAGAPVEDEDLLDEVTKLVEAPSVVIGHFAEELLALPPRLLVESMKKNQRYFPLYRGGALTNGFLVVTNNPLGDPDLIAAGNARVLNARFHDAKFFYAADRTKTLAGHGEKLAGMMWIRGLGTMAERQTRLAEAAGRLAKFVQADPEKASAAGLLCKCDLTTQMVGEFPELQGHVGRLLADADPVVALAIEEHYLPRFADDVLPTTPEGAALALAERITLLDAAFGAGMVPKGSSDALGLRRAAGGLVALILGWKVGIPLPNLFEEATGRPLSPELRDFVVARLRASLQDEAPTDLVDAVLASGPHHLLSAADRVRALTTLPAADLAAIRGTFKRAAGLVKDHASGEYDHEALLVEDADRALSSAVWALRRGGGDLPRVLAELLAIRPVLARFFDEVLVMHEDPALRNNRLGMLRAIVDNFSSLADFSRLSSGDAA